MKVGIISQARMTSSRLPGKVLLPAGGKPMLEHHVNRLRDAGAPLYLAITERPEDDPLEAFAREHELPFFREMRTMCSPVFITSPPGSPSM